MDHHIRLKVNNKIYSVIYKECEPKAVLATKMTSAPEAAETTTIYGGCREE